jgi:hypothetical protein
LALVHARRLLPGHRYGLIGRLDGGGFVTDVEMGVGQVSQQARLIEETHVPVPGQSQGFM